MNVIADLCTLYDNLETAGKINPAYMNESFSYIICLTEDGKLDAIISCKEPHVIKKGGKAKEEFVAKKYTTIFSTPGRDANVLEKKFKFIFGCDRKNVSKETIEKNIKFKKAVAEYFEGLESPLIHAYKEFVKNWDPVKDFDNEILANHRKNTDADTAKYLFCLTGDPGNLLQNDPIFKDKWESNFSIDNGDSDFNGYCGITGEYGPIARLHDQITGPVFGYKGCAFTSCNDDCSKSYGLDQSYNCAVSVRAMHKYTRALNYMLENHRKYTFYSYKADGTDNKIILFWTDEIDTEAEDIFSWLLYNKKNDNPSEKLNDVKELFYKVKVGSVTENDLKTVLGNLSDITFHILEVRVENEARAAVRDYRVGKFLDIVEKAVNFQKSLSFGEETRPYSYLSLVKAIIPPTDKFNPATSEYLFQAINNAAYHNGHIPLTIAEKAITRTNAEGYKENDEKKENKYRFYTRTAIMKSYLIGKGENITTMLNTENTNIGYLCGRFLAVADSMQKSANKNDGTNTNSTFADLYLRKASTNPAAALNIVSSKLPYCEKKFKRCKKEGIYSWYNSMLNEIVSKIDNGFPKHLNLTESAAFYVGFRQQKMDLYKKKDKDNSLIDEATENETVENTTENEKEILEEN